MNDFNGKSDVDDLINESLIELVKKCPSLYHTDVYTKSDEDCWDDIAAQIGMQS